MTVSPFLVQTADFVSPAISKEVFTGYSRDRDERTPESSPELRICRSPTAPQIWDGWFAKSWTAEKSPQTRSAKLSAIYPAAGESRERSRRVAADATLRRASAAGT